MTLGSVYFYLFAALAIVGAIGTVAAQNPIRCALGLMVAIVSIAALFLPLSAPFLAAIQLIVYAGAVVVLFLFVIMLLGPDAVSPRDGHVLVTRVVGGGLFLAASLGALALVARHFVESGRTLPEPKAAADFGTIDAVGRELFTTFLVPFELSSALLMVAVLGAVSVGKGTSHTSKASKELGT